MLAGSVNVPHVPLSAREVRHRVRAELAAARVPVDLVDDVELVLAELVSNAVRHAQPGPDGGLVVGWRAEQSAVEVYVSDGGSPLSVTVRPEWPMAVGGRGLHLVSGLARAWGIVERRDGGRTVWASVVTDS